MGIMSELNYSYNNPDAKETQQLTPHKDIVIVFSAKKREKDVTKALALWASMSKENTGGQLEALINENEKEIENGITK